jgi:hypothetical protein
MEKIKPSFAISRHTHIEPMSSQTGAHHTTNLRFVVNNQNPLFI